MGRRAATFWHATSSVAAGVLYFFFVLPRWPELMGDTSHALGTAARIVAGVLIALAALPVVFTLLQLRKPEFGTPALALTLRTWSVVAHVVAGVLIVGTAISEIWLNLDSVGQWLFGIYGAAAAVAVLGIFAFYLSFVAELPPPPPKPLKPKKEKKQRRRGKKDDEAEDSADADEEDSAKAAGADDEAATADDGDDSKDDENPEVEVEAAAVEAESTADEAPATEDAVDAADTVADDSAGGLRNRRPTGKVSHRRRRPRRGVAVEE
ncbi:MAG TPA: hypothetical protein VN856_10830 [Mycobacterium sp.]|jgi:hypothetical protein|uniref:hypothetical protein n=1 Tax=Mycobacterium sp. TaxID=1785 RepID=UPI002CDC0157|nr:hypothetical protein [Mycobacterium sp.]HXO80369.1 hypothetical protein [Mycobacterium sp.]